MSPWVTGKDVSAGVLGLPLLSTGSPNAHLPFHRPLAVSMLLGVFQGHTLFPASQHPGPISEGDRSAAHVSCIEMKHKQCSLNNNNNKNPVPIFMYLKEDGSKNLRKNNVFWLPILIVFLPKYFLGLESYWAFLCLLLKRNVMLLRVLWQGVILGWCLCTGVNPRYQRGCPAWRWSNSSESNGVIPTLYYRIRSSFSCTNNSWH